MTPTLQDTIAQLESLGNEKVRAINYRNGAGDKQFGVQLGDIRKLAAKIKVNQTLAMALWRTGNLDARLLAILILNPNELTASQLEKMVRACDCAQLADWLNSYVVKNFPGKEALRTKWMADDHPWAARAGWGLTAERINKEPDGIDQPGLLDRLESEMANAPPEVQWTMNSCLAGIGIKNPKLRKRAIDIGERLGIYRDYPCAKGCTSPFAPIWIREMVKRQKLSSELPGRQP